MKSSRVDLELDKRLKSKSEVERASFEQNGHKLI